MSYVVGGIDYVTKQKESRLGSYLLCFPETAGEERMHANIEQYIRIMLGAVGARVMDDFETGIELEVGEERFKIFAAKAKSVLEDKLKAQTSTTV